MKLLLVVILVFSFFSVSHANTETGNKGINVKEWQVPWPDSRPRDPAVDSNGIVWFCGQAGNYIANLDPLTGKFSQFVIPDNTHPHNLIIDADDFIWYAGNRNSHIGKLNPKTGDIEQYTMPGDVGIDPHTLVFNAEQNIWFTAQWANKVGYLNVKTGEITLIDIPIASARPYGIKVDYDNTPWVVLFGIDKIARINPVDFSVQLFDLTDKKERPRRLEITQDNTIYYLDHNLGYLGAYNPMTKQMKRWLLSEGEHSKLYGSAIDNHDRIWLALTGSQPNKIKVFDTYSKMFISEVDISSGGGSIRYMYYSSQGDEVWFGTDANTIGRAKFENKIAENSK